MDGRDGIARRWERPLAVSERFVARGPLLVLAAVGVGLSAPQGWQAHSTNSYGASMVWGGWFSAAASERGTVRRPEAAASFYIGAAGEWSGARSDGRRHRLREDVSASQKVIDTLRTFASAGTPIYFVPSALAPATEVGAGLS